MSDNPYASPVHDPGGPRFRFAWRYLSALGFMSLSLGIAWAMHRLYWLLLASDDTGEVALRTVTLFGPFAAVVCFGTGVGCLFGKPLLGAAVGATFGVTSGCLCCWFTPIYLSIGM